MSARFISSGAVPGVVVSGQLSVVKMSALMTEPSGARLQLTTDR
ncbi:MAG: hypothetical protein U0Z53_02210 [Blastocatellia bacterium]